MSESTITPQPMNPPVAQVFCDALEKLAFMFADPISTQELPAISEPCMAATITFSGTSSGQLSMLAPASVALELTSNMLGVDPDEALDAASDALGEMMNVTLGRLLTVAVGDVPVFDLTPPRVSEASPEQWDQMLNQSDIVALLVGDKPVLLKFSMIQ